MDIIAMDIGNSRVSLAVFAQGELKQTEHFDIDALDALKDCLCKFRQLCGPQPLGAQTVPVVACSVNSDILADVERIVTSALDQRVLLVGREFPLDMKVALDNVEAVGSDRLVTAFAAYEVIQSAVLVADFGSATTMDCVSDSGIFLGGVIVPGLNLSARALGDYTSALPEVQPDLPRGAYGTNTVVAIQNGIYYAALGSLREMAERYAEELGQWPQVVATGGYCNLIARNCEFIDSVVPDLCLNGLYLAYRNYRESKQATE